MSNTTTYVFGAQITKKQITAENYISIHTIQDDVMLYATQLCKLVRRMQLNEPLHSDEDVIYLETIDMKLRAAGNCYIDDDMDFYRMILRCLCNVD
jgi:hypothetical protein